MAEARVKAEIPAILDAFSSIRVAVIGEAMLDVYIAGSSNRLCQEAPVPAVTVEGRAEVPGGAGNVAANVAALGARATCLSVLGDDREGQTLQDLLRRRSVATEPMLAQTGRRTLAKHRVVGNGQILLRFDHGDVGPVNADVERALAERLPRVFAEADLLIISDFGYGMMTPRVIAELAALQSQSPRFLVVASKNFSAYRSAGVTAVKPSREQAGKLLGTGGDGGQCLQVKSLMTQEAKLFEALDAPIAVVTLDADGAVVFERGRRPHRNLAVPAPDSRAIGAGDTYLAAFALALTAGADTQIAGEIASAAARVVTREEGTTVCRHEDLCREILSRRTLGDELIFRPEESS